MKQVSQVLRAAMVEAEKQGVSLYRIAKACELDDSIVYRFYHDECGLALSSVDRLCQYLGLELSQSKSIGSIPALTPAKAPSAPRKTAKKPAKKKTAKTKATQKKATKKKAAKKKATKKKAKKKTRR